MEASNISVGMDVDERSEDLIVAADTDISKPDKKIRSDVETDKTSDNANNEISEPVRKRPRDILSTHKPYKKTPDTDTELGMQAALSYARGGDKTVMNKDEINTVKSFENAVCALQAMPDIDEELLMDASDLLEDERNTEIFSLGCLSAKEVVAEKASCRT